MADAPRPPALYVGYPVSFEYGASLIACAYRWAMEVFKALLCTGRMGKHSKTMSIWHNRFWAQRLPERHILLHAALCAAIRRRMRRNNKSETSRLIARQSKEKRDRRPESAQVTGCVMRREGAPIGVGCGIPLQAKRCACASAERILRHLSNRGLALRANRSDRAPRATAGNAGKQGGRREDGGAAVTDSHPKAIS